MLQECLLCILVAKIYFNLTLNSKIPPTQSENIEHTKTSGHMNEIKFVSDLSVAFFTLNSRVLTTIFWKEPKFNKSYLKRICLSFLYFIIYFLFKIPSFIFQISPLLKYVPTVLLLSFCASISHRKLQNIKCVLKYFWNAGHLFILSFLLSCPSLLPIQNPRPSLSILNSDFDIPFKSRASIWLHAYSINTLEKDPTV